MNGIFFLFFFSKILFSISITPTWKVSNCYHEIQTQNSHPIRSECKFQATSSSTITSIKTYSLGDENFISVTSGSITKECKVPFITIDSYVAIDDIFYICPLNVFQAKLIRYDFNSNTYEELIQPEEISKGLNNGNYTNKNWQLKCMHRPENHVKDSNEVVKGVLVAFLGVEYIYWYCESNNVTSYGKWGYQVSLLDYGDYFIDVHLDEQYFSDDDTNHKYYGYYYLYYNNAFMMQYGKMTIQKENNEYKWQQVGQKKNTIVEGTDFGKTKILTQKKSDGKFYTYIMTYGENGYNFYSASTTNGGNSFTQGPEYKFPLDFAPDTYYFTDFDFINDSTNFYYKVKTSSGKVYWGFGELLTDSQKIRIVFNSDEQIESVIPYGNSERGGLVTTSSGSFFICPYEFSSSYDSCDTCPSGKKFFINSNYKNECIAPGSVPDNMVEVDGEYQCATNFYPSKNSTECKSCSELNGYIVYPTNTCENDCDTIKGVEFTDPNDNSIKTCSYCYLNNTFKYDGKCEEESSLPTNTFISDKTYHIVSDCSSQCATCKENADKCLTCSSGYYLLPNSNNCDNNVDVPPVGFEHYGIDISNTSDPKWAVCDNSNNQYRYLTKDDTVGYKCVEKPATGVYEVSKEINGFNYTFIDHCHTNCETCDTKGDSTDNKCTKCKNGLYQLLTKCVTDCDDPNYFYDTDKRNCSICADSSSFKYSGKDNSCIYPQPVGTIVVNATFGIIEDCNRQCSECSAVSNDDINPMCIKCKDNNYVTPDGKCFPSCDESYVQDDSEHECINCREKYSATPYKESGTNQCIATPSVAFHIMNETTGLIFLCGPPVKNAIPDQMMLTITANPVKLIFFYPMRENHVKFHVEKTTRLTLMVSHALNVRLINIKL